MGAQPPEVVEGGRATFGVVVDVVDLQVAADSAAGDVALAPLHQKGGTEAGIHVATEMGDGRDVGSALDHGGQKRLAEEVPGPAGVDLADAGDLALLTGESVPPDESGVVDDDVDRGRGAGRAPLGVHLGR